MAAARDVLDPRSSVTLYVSAPAQAEPQPVAATEEASQ
jgi:hypothetical protein